MEKSALLPIGVVLRRSPGVSRWARWSWRAVAVLPGAGPADWKLLRSESGPNGETSEFHAATVVLELHRTETEAYRAALATEPPSVWVVMRPSEDENDAHDMSVHLVTASPYEGQDYLDSGEEIVEAVPMPASLISWVSAFVERHHVDEPFKKRRRDRFDTDQTQDGVGDARVRQDFDVYRSPAALKPKRTLQ